LLNLALTSRNGVPDVRLPFHAANNTSPRILKAGRKSPSVIKREDAKTRQTR